MSTDNSQEFAKVLSIPHGAKLDNKDSLALASFLWALVGGASQRRNRTLLRHGDLRQTIGEFMEMVGMDIEIQKPFKSAGSAAEKREYDIVARMDDWAGIVQVYEESTKDNIGEMSKTLDALDKSKVRAKVYLGTDILKYGYLASGSAAGMARTLSEDYRMGVIFADEQYMVVCDNYSQVLLEEMPEIIFAPPKEKRGKEE